MAYALPNLVTAVSSTVTFSSVIKEQWTHVTAVCISIHRLLQLAEMRRRYSKPPAHGNSTTGLSYITRGVPNWKPSLASVALLPGTESEVTLRLMAVRMSWRWTHCRTCDQILILSEFCCLVSLGRPLWREVGSVSCQSLSSVIVQRQFFSFWDAFAFVA
jgi:hypothetical protein